VAGREEFYAAALDILAKDGARALKIAPLCRAVGVTSGSFYHHFGAWSVFVTGLLEHWEREQTGSVLEIARATPDPLERIEVTKRMTAALRHDVEVAIRAWATVHPDVGRAQQRVDAMRKVALTEVLGGIIPDREEAERLAEFGVCLLVGFQQTVSDLSEARLLRIFDEYQDVLVRHAGGSPSSSP
jgi:AcrR family transcriptional regulator